MLQKGGSNKDGFFACLAKLIATLEMRRGEWNDRCAVFVSYFNWVEAGGFRYGSSFISLRRLFDTETDPKEGNADLAGFVATHMGSC